MTLETFAFSRRKLLAGTAALAAAPAIATLGARPAKAAAPMMGASNAVFRRVKLGAFEITTILDGARAGGAPHPTFGNNQDPAAVAKYAEDNNVPSQRSMNSFTPVMVNTGRELIMFDSGNGTGARPDMSNTADRIKLAGYDPANVDIVVITHYHGDHIGGLVQNGNPLFPNARYVAGEVEHAWWTSTDRVGTPAENGHKLALSNVDRFKDKMTFVKEGSTVVSGITAIETFGHSPGHMSFHIESEGKRFLIWGDIANHYVLALQKPEWHASFDAQKDVAVATRKKIFDMVATDRVPVSGYHMPFPAIGYLEKAGEGYRWVAHTYQLDV